MFRKNSRFGQILKNDRSLKRAAIVLTVSALVIALLSTVGEFIFYRFSTTGEILSFRLRKISQSPAQPQEKEEPLNPPLKPLRILPTEITGFETTARQPTPGERYAAEAIYNPENEELSPAAPLNTYVKITFHGSEEEASGKIKQTLADRYNRDSIVTAVDGQAAYAGYGENDGSYYLAWNWKGYSIEITTSYTQIVPQERGTLLSDLSSKVAQGLLEKIKSERS